ncbi:MAG: ABC transporter permease subunit/CPBP intramembrane protease [Pirellulaceae bacterium]
MHFSNVKLILNRELRDQLRDRRTLFSVLVLPVMLYPLMGLLMTQVMQLQRTQPTKVRIIGGEEIPQRPPLVQREKSPLEEVETTDEPGYQFADQVLERIGYDKPGAIDLRLEVESQSMPPEEIETLAQTWIDEGITDAVLYFPPGFQARIEQQRQDSAIGDASEAEFPEPLIFISKRRARSAEAEPRVYRIVQAWRDLLIIENLRVNEVADEVTNPFKVETLNLADESTQGAFLWARIFPFILVIWALTGAFYPAVDLCAGEKERGTLETLLSSPALRSEIVAGKLLAIMAFSIATSLLNLASLGFTAKMVFGQMASPDGAMGQMLGPPPLWSLGWLLLALIPMAALFSSLALAIAAMARSSKEGQYYLLPLLMINLPLVVIPVLPSVELNFATSLIPVTGVLLLLKALMESEFQLALTYLLPVGAVTTFGTWVSIRWAIDQFNNESVLFRESEQFSLKLWARHIWRDRKATPTASQAIMMGLGLLLIKTFGGGWIAPPESALGFVRYMLTIQLVTILLPVILVAWLLVRDFKKTFLLQAPAPKTLLVSVGLAVGVHPFVVLLGENLRKAFPLPDGVIYALQEVLGYAELLPLWAVLLLFALLPAVCEEFAFRGFILSGLRRLGHKWAAIVVSALFFGVIHGILQQSIAAAIVGMLIGYIAVQTGTLWAAIVYHACHNSLSLLNGIAAGGIVQDGWLTKYPALRLLFAEPTEGAELATYHPWVIGFCGILAVLLIHWLSNRPAEMSEEERRRNVLDHQSTYTKSSGMGEDRSPFDPDDK